MEFLTVKQAAQSLDWYIGQLRDRLKLVLAAFDDLIRAGFLNGVDPVHFDRPIDQ